MNGTRCRRFRISSITAILYQKFTASHHLLAVEPDIEIAANAVDVGFGNPIRPSVFGIRMTEGDMNAGNFFVLQNVTDDVGDRKSTRLNSSHSQISYAVFCLKKKNNTAHQRP